MAVAFNAGSQGSLTVAATSVATSTFVATATHDLFVAVSIATTSISVSSISDTAGNSFTLVGTSTNSTTVRTELWKCLNILGNASNIVTANLSGSSLAAIAAADYTEAVATVGAPTYGAAQFAHGLTATSDSNYISLPSGPLSVVASGTWTVEMWLKTTSSANVVALSSADGTLIFAANAGKFYFNPGVTHTSTASINDGNWHLVAVVVANGTGKIFIDGALDSTFQVVVSTTNFAGLLGRFSSAGFAWPGSIDEVSFWSTNKYTTTYTPPVAAYVGNEANLVWLFHLDDNPLNSATTRGFAASTATDTGTGFNPRVKVATQFNGDWAIGALGFVCASGDTVSARLGNLRKSSIPAATAVGIALADYTMIGNGTVPTDVTLSNSRDWSAVGLQVDGGGATYTFPAPPFILNPTVSSFTVYGQTGYSFSESDMDI